MPQVDFEALAEACPEWTPAEWQSFATMSPEDQATLAQALVDSGVPADDDSGLAKAIKILETAATVAGTVVGLGSGVLALKAAIKGA